MSRIEEMIKELCPNEKEKNRGAYEWLEIKDIFEMRNGYTPSKSVSSYWEDGNIPWFRMEDIRQNGHILSDSIQHISKDGVKNGKLFKANSFILATTATIGEHALIITDSLANQRFTNLEICKPLKDRLLVMFVYYYLFIIDEWCKNNVNVSGFASLDMERFKKLRFPLPPLSVQREIVSVLDSFTSLIDKMKQEVEMRKRQMEYYREKMMTFEENTPKLSFGEDFTLKARIGWQGLTKKEYQTEGEYKLITGTDFTTYNTIDFDHCVFVSKERYEQDSNIQVKVGDVLITKDGTLGKIAYISELPLPATLNGGVFVVRGKSDVVMQSFLKHYLASNIFKDWIEQNHTSGSIMHLTQSLLVKFCIPAPPLPVQRRIVATLDTFEAYITKMERLIALRQKQYEYYRERLLTFA